MIVDKYLIDLDDSPFIEEFTEIANILNSEYRMTISEFMNTFPSSPQSVEDWEELFRQHDNNARNALEDVYYTDQAVLHAKKNFIF